MRGGPSVFLFDSDSDFLLGFYVSLSVCLYIFFYVLIHKLIECGTTVKPLRLQDRVRAVVRRLTVE